MHPILGQRRVLAAYLAAWTAPAALLATVLAPGQWLGVLLAGPLAIVYAFVCLSAWYVCLRTPLRSARPVLVLANAIGSAAISAGAWVLCARMLAAALDSLGMPGDAASTVVGATPLLFASGALVYLLAAAIAHAAMAVGEARAAERRALELQVLAREAELKALRAQVDPHFLFNSLHSIGGLIGSDPAGARRMCLLLGEFLRSSMRLGAQDRIPLADEVGLARRFLDIEHVRFGDRLLSDLVVDEAVSACPVPPLLLQPLVENAVRHGIGGLVDGGTIRLDARADGPRVRIAIENPRDPDSRPCPGTGVGLENVRKRLLTHYGADGALRVTEHPGSFRVDLTFPCRIAADHQAGDAH